MLKTDGLFLGSAHLLVFVDTESADRVCPQIRRTLYKECLTLLKYGSYEKQIIGCKRVNHKSVKLMKIYHISGIACIAIIGFFRWMRRRLSCKVYGFNVWDWLVPEFMLFPFPALMFIECCIKTQTVWFPCVISFKRTIPHCFRKSKLLAPISRAGNSSSPATSRSRPGNILHGAGRQHGWCLPTTP